VRVAPGVVISSATGHIADDPFPWRPAASLGLDRPCFIGEVPIQLTRFAPAEPGLGPGPIAVSALPDPGPWA
jgi:hypothetical protein